MRIFDLVAFTQNEHLTIRLKPHSPSSKTFGDIAVSYLLIPKSHKKCRLVVKLVVKYPLGIRGQLMGLFLPWGDLIMMRRQLLNFKRLAEGMEKKTLAQAAAQCGKAQRLGQRHRH